MKGFSATCPGFVAIGLLLGCQSSAPGQSPSPAPTAQTATATANALTYKIHSLSDLKEDPAFCQWVADTIPDVVHPDHWTAGGPGKLKYNAATRVLVVYGTPAIHEEVDTFLKTLQTKLSQTRSKVEPRLLPAAAVTPTQFITPGNGRPVQGSVTQPAYPVAAPLQMPKHLFHFIIRYEGEGVIDSNVVNFAKTLANQAGAGIQYSTPVPGVVMDPFASPPPMCAPPPPMQMTTPVSGPTPSPAPKHALPVPPPPPLNAPAPTNRGLRMPGADERQPMATPIPHPPVISY